MLFKAKMKEGVNMNNKRMTRTDRLKLEALYNAGVPVKVISDTIGFSFQAVYYELKKGFYMHRNTDWTETKKYSADKAQAKTDYENTSKGAQLKLGNDYEFVNFVSFMIVEKKYSPNAVLGYIKQHNLKFKTKVCRVTLYSYIEKGLIPNVTNKNLLRKGSSKKKNKNSVGSTPNEDGLIENISSIQPQKSDSTTDVNIEESIEKINNSLSKGVG